jgi:hypothetical protein
MDSKPLSKRQLSKSHASVRYGDQNSRKNDHRQTMNSVVIEERKRVGKQKTSEASIRERDLLHRNLNRSPEKEMRQAYDNDNIFEHRRIENTRNNMVSANRGPSIKQGSVGLDQNLSSKEHRLRADGLPLDTRRDAKSIPLQKSHSDRSLVTPTGTLKPPLKPRRSRRSKSVTSSTKSTSSATYVSSDSSDGEKDDDSIETPDLRIRVFDGQTNSPNQSCSWSTASPLAPYDSSDDYSRLAMVPYQESKKKKKSRSRQSSYPKSCKLTTANSDDDDIDPFFNLGDDDFANVYNLSSSDSDTSDVDLDEMIAESSARWKTTVNAIVTKTVTATQGNLVVPGATASSLTGPIVPSLPMKLKVESNVIEKQQAEIESLRAALKAQRQHNKFSSEMLVLPETTEFEAPSDFPFRSFPSPGTEDITIDCVPLEHIEVNHDASDPNSSNYWQDDLTVWSGFNTVTGGMDGISSANHDNAEKVFAKPPPTKRPDAASNSGASALNGVPVRVVKDMKVDLSSEMTSIVRKAVYSGTINAHTRQPEGQGTFRFIETGDTYQGEVHAGHMHGAGTYTFGRLNKKSSSKSKRPKELKGTFEYNVFIG